MLTLFEASTQLLPFLKATSRIPVVPIVCTDNRLIAFNGELMGIVEFEGSSTIDSWAVSGQRVLSVLRDDSVIIIQDTRLIIKNGRFRFKLPVYPLDGVMLGPMPDDVAEDNWIELSSADVNAIILASKFSSENSDHAWAQSVTLYKKNAVATNNVSLVAVELDNDNIFEEPLVLPSWFMPLMKPGIKLSISGTKILFKTDYVYGYGLMLEATPPESFLETMSTLMEKFDDLNWQHVSSLREAFNNIEMLSDRYVVFDSAVLSTKSKDDCEGEADIDWSLQFDSE